MNELSIDFETACHVDIKLGAWRYVTDPTFELLCMAYAFPGEEPQLWWPGDAMTDRLLDWFHAKKPIRAWNAEFEVAVHTAHLAHRYNLPTLKPSQVHCTQAEALAMSLPAKLAECGEALGVAEEHLKDPEGKRLIQYLCRPYKGRLRKDPERLARLGDYCVQDVVAETAIAQRLRRLDDRELRLFRRNMNMNLKGLPVDLSLVSEMSERVDELQSIGTERCQQLTGGITPTQRDKLLTWLNDNGAELPNLQKQTLERTDLPGDVGEVISLRLEVAQTSLAKLKKLPMAVCADGTMKGLFKYHAASTGRWASQGGFNAQNLPRGELTPEQMLDIVHGGIDTASLKDLTGCLRAVFSFPMSVVDYSQIETRMLLWLAKDIRGLREFEQGLDPYKTMAARIYHMEYQQVEKWQRQIGKSAVLGAGYQLGWKGFIAYCDNQDITVDEAEAVMVIDAFRDKYKAVTAAWRACQNAAVGAIENPGTPYMAARAVFIVKGQYLWIRLPSGRRICYRTPWLTPGKEDWMGPQINFYGRDRYTRKWSKQTTYGGSLFQSITQGSARDVMADAMLRMWDAGIDVRGTVHDEIIAYGEDLVDQMSEIMLELPEWCSDMPVAVDGWSGRNYRK